MMVGKLLTSRLAKSRWAAALTFVCAALVVAVQAQAAITYDANVTPTQMNGTLWYGAGNNNGGFTVDTQSGLELGLRTHTRYPSSSDSAAGIMSHGNGVYGNFAAQGFDSSGNPAAGPRGSWNLDYSIYTPGGALSNFTYQLNITSHTSAGVNFVSLNPIVSFPDNAPLGSTTIAQNSENLGFGQFGPLSYNPGLSGVYDVTLLALNPNGGIAGQTSITVLVGDATLPVPEPASLVVWGAMSVLGAAFGWRRRRAS